MKTDNYSEKNREAWNEAASVHRKKRKVDYTVLFKNKNYSVLDNTLSSLLNKISLSGGTVAQLCCNDGRELLSIVNTTGATGVGFDISDEFIAEASTIAKSTNLDCRFVRTNIYDLNTEYDNTFDSILFTAGALTWFHDLGRLFELVARMLKPEGHLIIYEIHPSPICWHGKMNLFMKRRIPIKLSINISGIHHGLTITELTTLERPHTNLRHLPHLPTNYLIS